MVRPPLSSGASRQAARAAIGAATLALLMLAAMHVLRHDMNPGGHMISEYAIGPFGWGMTLSFVAFAVGSGSLFMALARSARTLLARIALAFLVLATIGLVIGALFPTDPPSTASDAMSFAGRMHGVGFMIGVPSQLLSVLLLSLSLRKQAAWSAPLLLGITSAMWLSVVVMVPLIVGQTAFFGIPNRTFMASFGLWLVMAARPVAAHETIQVARS